MLNQSSSIFFPLINSLIFDSHSLAPSKPLMPCW